MRILDQLLREKDAKYTGGLYRVTQIEMAFNSNRIEGSRLSKEQTRYLFETNTLLHEETSSTRVSDLLATINHFRAFDRMLETADEPLSEGIIKEYHAILLQGTTGDADWIPIGEYKVLPNTIGDDIETTSPEKVQEEMQRLLQKYQKGKVDLQKIIAFHHALERIHPFQDGNGRVGRLLMFKESLRHDIVPFVIDDTKKFFYYRGLNEFRRTPGYLVDTILSSQDQYKEWMQRFSPRSKEVNRTQDRGEEWER